MVELERIQGVWNRHRNRFLERHFHPDELAYCLKQRNSLPSLAARFAAKEAFQKCWPESHGWRDVWVLREEMKPVLHYSEAIEEVMEREGWSAHLSLTHSKAHAAAVVVLEKLD